MPRYQYVCSSCDKVIDQQRVIAKMKKPAICPDCGANMPYHFSAMRFGAHAFKPYWEENMSAFPVYIESKRQLKELARETGCQPTSLL